MRVCAIITSLILMSVLYILHGYFTDVEKCSQNNESFYSNGETLCYQNMNINSSISAKKDISIQSFKIIDNNHVLINSTVGNTYEMDYINGTGIIVNKIQ